MKYMIFVGRERQKDVDVDVEVGDFVYDGDGVVA